MGRHGQKLPLSQNIFILRRSEVANFADVIKFGTR